MTMIFACLAVLMAAGVGAGVWRRGPGRALLAAFGTLLLSGTAFALLTMLLVSGMK